SWRFAGNVERVARIRIELVGKATAMRDAADRTRTEVATFAVIPMIDTDARGWIAGGTVNFVVPADTIPSFEAPHSRIAWDLVVPRAAGRAIGRHRLQGDRVVADGRGPHATAGSRRIAAVAAYRSGSIVTLVTCMRPSHSSRMVVTALSPDVSVSRSATSVSP